MAVQAESIQLGAQPKPGRAVGGLSYDWVMMIACIWFVGGLFIDGWAHNNGKVDQSFFTPWHAIFYSGFAVVASVLIGAVVRNHALGLSWRRAIPAGYELAIVGMIVFSFGGVFDLIWHSVFGIEVSFQALYSPSHMMLGLGLVLLASSPIRAAWRRPVESGWSRLLPLLISLMFTLSIFTFFTQVTHPFINEYATTQSYNTIGYPGSSGFVKEVVQIAGVLSVILQSGLLMGFILLALRRWTLPLGSMTFIMGLNLLFMVVIVNQQRFLPVILLAGIASDVLLFALKPSMARPVALRIFAFGVPAILFGLYYGFLLITYGTLNWSTHLWTGAIVLAGITGLVLSYLVLPSPGASIPIKGEG